jgi:hypothetical protein
MIQYCIALGGRIEDLSFYGIKSREVLEYVLSISPHVTEERFHVPKNEYMNRLITYVMVIFSKHFEQGIWDQRTYNFYGRLNPSTSGQRS